MQCLHGVALRAGEFEDLTVPVHVLGADARIHHAATAATEHATTTAALATVSAVVSAAASAAGAATIARLTPAATAGIVTSSPTT